MILSLESSVRTALTSVNIVQGVRGNGRVSNAIKLLRPVDINSTFMESLRLQGPISVIKELLYICIFFRLRFDIKAVSLLIIS